MYKDFAGAKSNRHKVEVKMALKSGAQSHNRAKIEVDGN